MVNELIDIAYLDGGPLPIIADVGTLFQETAENFPDVEAVVCLHQKPFKLPGIVPAEDVTRLAWTYKQIDDASANLTNRLRLLGVHRGTSIAFVSDNCAEWALFCWIAVRLECPFVPMNPAVVSNTDELKHMLQVTCPGVVVVQSHHIGKQLDLKAPEEMAGVIVKLVLSDQAAYSVLPSSDDLTPNRDKVQDGRKNSDAVRWLDLQQLWLSTAQYITGEEKRTKRSFENTIIIGFTSGTTSLPKACPQSSKNIQMTCAAARERGIGPKVRTLQQGPLYHGLAGLLCLASWANGATIVIPSSKFDVMASLDAIEKERCTSMAAVPAVIKAFTMVPNILRRDLSSVKSITIAGAPVFPDTIRLCREVLQIQRVGVSWGMTENPAPISASLLEGMELGDDEFFPVGKPTPGMKVKICAPGSRTPLRRGEEGELHAGGSQVIRGYLDADNDIFYEDEEGRWIMTGDMGSIADDGNVRILGRYKDIIIRGGANIAPASIEQQLNNVPGVDSQVIGIPDEIAGEMPVAVVRLQDLAYENLEGTIGKLQAVALNKFGPKSAPTLYLDLQRDLHMKMFPMTSSGKVKKAILRKKVQEFMKQKNSQASGIPSEPQSTEKTIADLWTQVSGISAEKLYKTSDILKFVDSITIMRFSGSVRRSLKKDISVADVVDNPSIQEQAALLDSRNIIMSSSIQKRNGPPTPQDMVHCKKEPSEAIRTQNLMKPLLVKLGLTWERDVEDVIPAPDTLSLYLRRSRPQTWNQRAIFIAHNTSHAEFLKAWKAALYHQPLMRSLAVKQPDSEQQLLVVMRHNETWWQCSILPDVTVSVPDDLRQTYEDEWANPDTGPLVRVAFATIKDSPADTGMIFIANHGVFDNMSANLFFEDLVAAVKQKLSTEDVVATPGHFPFKEYADVYHVEKKGRAAKETVTWHTNRLRGIGNLRKGLWPVQRAPGWFKGADAGWKNLDGTVGDPSLRKPLDPEEEYFGLDGLTRTANAPGLLALTEQYAIKPHIVLKGAVALFNTHRTGCPTALFANLEAARYWPWVSDAGKAERPNPLNVAGPMFEVVVNRIDLTDRTETVLKFLERLQEDQVKLSSHSHVPLFDLLAGLPKDDAEVLKEIIDRQIWNWPAGIQAQAQAQAASSQREDKDEVSFKKLTRAAYDDVGIAWTCGLSEKETFYLNASYDSCQLSKSEAFEALGEVLSAASWLVANLESSIADVVFEGDIGDLIPSLE